VQAGDDPGGEGGGENGGAQGQGGDRAAAPGVAEMIHASS
jgi:hypothetical protein